MDFAEHFLTMVKLTTDMMPNLKTVWVDGDPIPQPRQRHRIQFPSWALFTSKTRALSMTDLWEWLRKQCRVINWVDGKHPVRAWKEAIIYEWRIQHGRNPVEEIPLGITLTFIRSRPKSMTKKTKPNPRLWDHWSVGDADNLAKAVLDALEGEAYKNDSQIAHLVVYRFIAAGDAHDGSGWDERTGVMIELLELIQDLTNYR